ncbi:MAG: hypothetical protein CMM83_00050 [Rhodospirillales bacterium]|nr:hypothetical protein [Rhodospirillales bacterium]|tara:strand:- start:2752 stop:3624 length:873 start_codon:yes stop_codon:yes gene_type:complete
MPTIKLKKLIEIITKLNISVLLISVFFFNICVGAFARTVESVGSYNYGPTVPEATACHLATQNARKEALNIGANEIVSGQDILLCTETGDTEKCLLNKSIWSEVTGLIRDLKIISKKIINSDKDYKTCRVKISADVKSLQGHKDPGFDFTATLNRHDRKYRHQEKIEFFISPSTKMYVTIFLWDPHDENKKQVSRIFPNRLDKRNWLASQLKVPTSNAIRPYEFRAMFSRNTLRRVILIDQYVLVVATRSPINFKKKYTPEELNGRLLEIPASDWRRKRIDFYVLSGKQP